MLISKLSNKALTECKNSLDHAAANREGGLLIAERIALDTINTEIEERSC